MMIVNIFKKGTDKLNSGINTWIVEWTARHGKFSGDTKQCYQAFTDKGEAERFAESIRRAHKLIGNTCSSEIKVTVRKQENNLSEIGLEGE